MSIPIETNQAIVRVGSHRAYDKLALLCETCGFKMKEVWCDLKTDHGYIIPRSLLEKALKIPCVKEVKADYKKEWKNLLSFRQPTNHASAAIPVASTSP
jgi:hypothetical protein